MRQERPDNGAATNPVDATPSADDPWGRIGLVISSLALRRSYWILPLLLWALLLGTSFWWNWSELKRHNFAQSTNQARQIASMIESMRSWNARHGGVYVPVDQDTRPNPYLDDPERDIPGPGGKRLTKVNPAFMTRQLTDIIRDNSGIIVHLTSLKPLNPGNQPDPWENAALKAFQNGDKERIELIEGQVPVFRYMVPFVTRQECLQCHERQGYKLGDIRGGLSVSFTPSEPLALEQRGLLSLLVSHLAAWLLLAGVTVAVLARFRHQILCLQEVNARQDDLVERRTRQLQVEIGERQQAEQWLQLLIDSSAEGVLAVDRNGACTLCNPTAATLLGYQQEELLSQPIRDLIAYAGLDGKPVDVRTCPIIGAFRRGQAAQEPDAVFWRADGRSLPVEYRAHPIRSGDALEGAVITFFDISGRKQSEARLRALSAAVEHSPTALAILDAEGIIEYLNPEFTKMTGYAVEELLGHSLDKLRSGQTPQETYDELWSILRAGRKWQGELTAKRVDGTIFWERASFSPIDNPAGPTTHYVALFEDITEQKRLQDAVWRHANYDWLTGLPNRNLFRDRLIHHLAQARRRNEGLAVMYIDLDGFKQVNDQLGHDAGDNVLREAGQRMAACLRSSDTIARLGGDEFAILLPGANSVRELEFVALRLVETLAAPFELGYGGQGCIAGSVGISILGGDEPAEELIRRADCAMYAAKRQGGSVFRFYQEGMEQTPAERAAAPVLPPA